MDFSTKLTEVRDIAAILAFTVAASTYFLNRDISTRNKKKAALELLKIWVERKESWSRAIELAASLNEEQAVNFWKGESINRLMSGDENYSYEQKARQENLANICLNFLDAIRDNCSDNSFNYSSQLNQSLLTAKQTIEIRRYVFSYLNILEIILLSWRDNIVDRDLIYEQFTPLVRNSRLFPNMLFTKEYTEELCKKSGNNCPKSPQECHPAITSFYYYCKNKNLK